LNAVVLTDHKAGASFPTDHPLYAGRVAISSPRANEVIHGADVVLSLDWIDLAGSLSMAWPDEEVGATVINCSSDVHGHNGWTMDHQGMAPVDIHLLADADTSVVSLMDAGVKRDGAPIALSDVETPTLDDAPLRTAHIAHALKAALGDDDFCFVRIGGGWPDGVIKFRGPLDYMGTDGGGGIGSGPGMTVGGALALRDSARIAISILGDGDFSMGMNALWTAAHYSLPMLIIVANNRSYFNDEMHQDRVARIRGREPANRWIGQRITDPELDIVGIAESQGLKGMGPVETLDDLHKVVAEGLDLVRAGAAVVIDARVTPIDSAAAATQVARKT
jgi:thiamine pyrophosphate-dependent acetolactate synthase large subunit-like protein